MPNDPVKRFGGWKDEMAIRFIRKTTIAVLVIATIDAFIVWIFGPRTINGHFTIMCYSGITAFFLSLFAMGSNRVSGYGRKPFISPDPVFMKARSFEWPFEETILSVTMAAILIFSIGQLLAVITF
jgi:hypothetical protein